MQLFNFSSAFSECIIYLLPMTDERFSNIIVYKLLLYLSATYRNVVTSMTKNPTVRRTVAYI